MSNTTNNTDPCYQPDEGTYDLGLHIGSIFVVLVTSWIGAMLPIVVSRNPKLSFARRLMNIGKFFGAGVITATGFIHIFPSAVVSLSDPCLPEWFSESYPASAGLFAMLSAMAMHLMEWLAIFHEPQKKITEGDEEGSPEHGHHDDHAHTLLLEERKKKITTYTLEFGISIHSVIIGISLGLSSSEFVALWIAISFHQFFEGIGLGAMLAELTFEKSRRHLVWISPAIYGLTTPIGIAVGIIISQTTYDATNQLITNGILDSISSGILIYTSLVTLLGSSFQSKRFTELPRWEKVLCFMMTYLGASAMAILAIWA